MENYCNIFTIAALPISFVINIILTLLLCRQKSIKKTATPVQDILFDENDSAYTPLPYGIHTPMLSSGGPLAHS